MKEWDRHYADIADCLERFASAYNLRIQKYLHNSPTWDFVFRHPAAGQAKIQVIAAETDSLVIAGSWWVDDFATFHRSVRFSDAVTVPCTCASVVEQLDTLLKQIVSWAPSDLVVVDRSFATDWTSDVRRNAEELISKLPLPTVPRV